MAYTRHDISPGDAVHFLADPGRARFYRDPNATATQPAVATVLVDYDGGQQSNSATTGTAQGVITTNIGGYIERVTNTGGVGVLLFTENDPMTNAMIATVVHLPKPAHGALPLAAVLANPAVVSAPEAEFSAEFDLDSKDDQDEVDRLSKEAQKIDAKRSAKVLNDILANQKKMTADIQSLVGKMTNTIAKDALKPAKAVPAGEAITDKATGNKELDALNKKVDGLLAKAEQADKSNSNGNAKESKLSKLAAFVAALVGLAPFMQNIFQVLVKAANGTLTATDVADTANQALIIALIKKWQNESDKDFWTDFAQFYQTHTAATQLAASGNLVTADPTSADLVFMLKLVSMLNTIDLATQPGFTWKDAKEKADTVTALANTYDASSLTTKVSFIQSLANIKVQGKTVPRGIQADLGCMAVSSKVS